MLNTLRLTLTGAATACLLGAPASATLIDPDPGFEKPDRVTFRDSGELGSRDLARTLRVPWADEEPEGDRPGPDARTRLER